MDFFGHGLFRHHGGGVGIDQHHLQVFFFQRPAGLGAGVVEFRRMPSQ